LIIVSPHVHCWLTYLNWKSIEIKHFLWCIAVPISMYSYVQFDRWLFDLKIDRGPLLHETYRVQVWCLSSNRFSKCWAVNIFSCPVSPLNFHLKINRNHGLFRMYQWLDLMSVKQNLLKTMSGQYIPIYSLTFDPRIKRGHWHFRVYHGRCISSKSFSRYWVVILRVHVYSNVQFYLWPFELKINKG
jgi:hypothetical protein